MHKLCCWLKKSRKAHNLIVLLLKIITFKFLPFEMRKSSHFNNKHVPNSEKN